MDYQKGPTESFFKERLLTNLFADSSYVYVGFRVETSVTKVRKEENCVKE